MGAGLLSAPGSGAIPTGRGKSRFVEAETDAVFRLDAASVDYLRDDATASFIYQTLGKSKKAHIRDKDVPALAGGTKGQPVVLDNSVSSPCSADICGLWSEIRSEGLMLETRTSKAFRWLASAESRKGFNE